MHWANGAIDNLFLKAWARPFRPLVLVGDPLEKTRNRLVTLTNLFGYLTLTKSTGFHLGSPTARGLAEFGEAGCVRGVHDVFRVREVGSEFAPQGVGQLALQF